MTIEEGKSYSDLKSMPPSVLAGRVVTSLIMAKGNIVMWEGIIQGMIEDAPTGISP